MINPIRNQKGIALVVTLMVLVLGFAIVAILFRLATQETKLTGLEQGYTSALDAAKAGTDLFIDMIETGLPNPPPPVSPYSGPPNPFGISTLGGQCLQIKMNTTPSSAWATPAWTTAGCPSVPNATSVFPPALTPPVPPYIIPTRPLRCPITRFTSKLSITGLLRQQVPVPVITAAIITRSLHGRWRRTPASMPTSSSFTATPTHREHSRQGLIPVCSSG